MLVCQVCQMPGRNFGSDSGKDTSYGSFAGVFRLEMVFEHVKDGFVPLADPADVAVFDGSFSVGSNKMGA